MVRSTEVYDFNRIMIFDIDYNILRLEIAMCDIIWVTVCDNLKQLLYDYSSLILRKVLSLDNLIKQFTAVTEFRDEVYLRLVLKDFIQSQNIGMVKVLEDIDFI